MKKILFTTLLFAFLVINIQPVFATIVCKGTSITDRTVKFILSAVEGKTITIDYTVYYHGEIVSKTKGTAKLIAHGRNINTEKIIQRAYLLRSSDNSYSIKFIIFADGTKAISDLDKDGGINHVKTVCKPKLIDYKK